jgi:hypothetical protein
MFHELQSRDREDGLATGQLVPRYRGIGSEAYLTGTSQSELVLLRYAQDKFPRRRNTRGRPAGRPYPRSQHVIREMSGLNLFSTSWRVIG